MLKKISAVAFGLAVALCLGAAPIYSYFSPGGALSGTATSQSVNLASGAFITGTLPVANGGCSGSCTSVPILSNGNWTPTLTAVTNVSSSSAFACQYLRVVSQVSWSCRVDITPTLITTQSELDMSLPIAADFATGQQAAGVCNGANSNTAQGYVEANTTNDRLAVNFISIATSAQPYFCTGVYTIP